MLYKSILNKLWLRSFFHPGQYARIFIRALPAKTKSPNQKAAFNNFNR